MIFITIQVRYQIERKCLKVNGLVMDTLVTGKTPAYRMLAIRCQFDQPVVLIQFSDEGAGGFAYSTKSVVCFGHGDTVAWVCLVVAGEGARCTRTGTPLITAIPVSPSTSLWSVISFMLTPALREALARLVPCR